MLVRMVRTSNMPAVSFLVSESANLAAADAKVRKMQHRDGWAQCAPRTQSQESRHSVRQQPIRCGWSVMWTSHEGHHLSNTNAQSMRVCSSHAC